MFRRFVRWLFRLQDPPPPEPLPDDAWKRMFVLADRLKNKTFGEFNIFHLDVIPPFYSNNVDELFERMEFLILSITDEDAILPGWKDRRREAIGIRMPDYFFRVNRGYRPVGEVVALLLEKISIIHNKFDTMELNEGHILYPFLRREFTAVVTDTNTVLEFCLSMAVTE